MKHVRNSDFGQLTVIETELLQKIPDTRTQEEVLRIREGAIREPEELKIKDFRLSNGCPSWYVIIYSEHLGSYMTWVEHRFLFYLKWIQEILYILPNQNKLFSFHLLSVRSVTWNLCKIKSFLKKKLGVKICRELQCFFPGTTFACQPAGKMLLMEKRMEGDYEQAVLGSKNGNSANCTADFCLSSKTWQHTG